MYAPRLKFFEGRSGAMLATGFVARLQPGNDGGKLLFSGVGAGFIPARHLLTQRVPGFAG